MIILDQTIDFEDNNVDVPCVTGSVAGSSHNTHRRDWLGSQGWFSCSALTIRKFLISFEEQAPYFHFAPGPANETTDPWGHTE